MATEDATQALAGLDVLSLPSAAPGSTPAIAGAKGAGRPVVLVLESTDSQARLDSLDKEFAVCLRVPPSADDRAVVRCIANDKPDLVFSKLSLEAFSTAQLAACADAGARIMTLARPCYGHFNPRLLRRHGGHAWIEVPWGVGGRLRETMHRVLDLFIVLISLPVVLPLMAVISLFVRMSGPVFYTQDRVGQHGAVFRMIKFRSMLVDAESETGPVLAVESDDRITRAGRILRRTRLDELPQLWNVVRGQMALVGPRPERPEFVADLRSEVHYDHRHLVRPGLTGIAQITGGYSADGQAKLQCDLLYLSCRSLRTDIYILLLTVGDFLKGFPRG